MSFIRGLGLGLTGCLLFFTLLILAPVLALATTISNPQFVINESEKLDISTAIGEYLADQMSIDRSYATAINLTTSEQETWIRYQMGLAIRECYYFWKGKIDTIDITLNLDPLRNSLADNLTRVYRDSPPADYQKLSPSEQASFVANARQDILDAVPSTLEINEANLGEDIMSGFRQVKDLLSLINKGLWILAGAAIVLVILLVLISRKGKIMLRSAGAVLIPAGVLTVLLITILRTMLLPNLYPSDLIPELQVWIPGVVNDVLQPALVLGWVFLSVGIILVGVSFFIRDRVQTPI